MYKCITDVCITHNYILLLLQEICLCEKNNDCLMMPQLCGVYFIHIAVFLSGNHKLTATAKVIVKICEHEVGTVN